MAFDYVNFLAQNKLTSTSRLNEKAKNLLKENYIDLRPINSLKEEKRFYAPDYIVQKYGAGKAKEIEANIFDAEETENNPNLWDLFTSLETPKEVDQFVRGYMNESTLKEEEDLDDEDIDVDIESDEDEYDFTSPGKKDEFDVDDIEPTAKDIKGGKEVEASGKQGKLQGLIKQKDAILAKFKSGQITIDQYKQEIGNIPQQIKSLQASIDQELSLGDDSEEEL